MLDFVALCTEKQKCKKIIMQIQYNILTECKIYGIKLIYKSRNKFYKCTNKAYGKESGKE